MPRCGWDRMLCYSVKYTLHKSEPLDHKSAAEITYYMKLC
jgi:hypothetical protein